MAFLTEKKATIYEIVLTRICDLLAFEIFDF